MIVDVVDTRRDASRQAARSRAGFRQGPVCLGLLVCLCSFGCSVYDDDAIEPAFEGGRGGSAGSKPNPPAGTGGSAGSAGTGGTAGSAGTGGSGGSAGNAGTGGSGGGAGSAGSCAAGGTMCQDECPDDPEKTAPGACGCGNSEADGDDDATPDCVDDCDDDPLKKTPGVCGCGAPDSDGDGDGSSDCADGCPEDGAKTAPGDCGCGVADSPTDTDDDGSLDCVDLCPMHAIKTQPGVCGCATAETGDGDTDGSLDCIDMCASDPGKTAPGQCGCGIRDADEGTAIGCVGLKSALVRRYRFEGSGTSVVDAKGGPAGTLIGGATMSGGSAVLNAAGEYVDLPNNILDGLTNATIEMWVTWTGTGGDWQRLFDFGSSNSGTGTSYLFLTARMTNAAPVMRLTFRGSGDASEVRVDSARALPANVPAHIAVVVDDTNNQLRFYLNTTLEGMATFNGQLSTVDDVNNWLGRSQFYSVDPELNGSIHEVRIYNTALSPAQLDFSLTRGMEPPYLPVE